MSVKPLLLSTCHYFQGHQPRALSGLLLNRPSLLQPDVFDYYEAWLNSLLTDYNPEIHLLHVRYQTFYYMTNVPKDDVTNKTLALSVIGYAIVRHSQPGPAAAPPIGGGRVRSLAFLAAVPRWSSCMCIFYFSWVEGPYWTARLRPFPSCPFS